MRRQGFASPPNDSKPAANRTTRQGAASRRLSGYSKHDHERTTCGRSAKPVKALAVMTMSQLVGPAGAVG